MHKMEKIMQYLPDEKLIELLEHRLRDCGKIERDLKIMTKKLKYMRSF